jgi:preprotein translocase subunit Sss1
VEEKKPARKQYIPALLLVVFAFYQLSKPDYWEFTMYLMAGVSFLLMGLIKEGWMSQYKKVLDAVSWTLIGLTVILFLYMVSTDGL